MLQELRCPAGCGGFITVKVESENLGYETTVTQVGNCSTNEEEGRSCGYHLRKGDLPEMGEGNDNLFQIHPQPDPGGFRVNIINSGAFPLLLA